MNTGQASNPRNKNIPISTSSRVMHSTNLLRLFVRIDCSRVSFSESPGVVGVWNVLVDLPGWPSIKRRGSERWMRCQ